MSRDYRLRVEEDKGCYGSMKIAKIPWRVMRELNLEPGDFIEIRGFREVAYAQVWLSCQEDEMKNVIRVDDYMRKALGIGLGDIVTISKVQSVSPGERVVLAPTEDSPYKEFISDEYTRYMILEHIMREMLNKPLARGEVILVPLNIGDIKLAVISTSPSTAIYITERTEIIIKPEPVEEIAEKPAITPITVDIEEKPAHMPSGVIQTREVLESIVAQVFKALGFNVWTNVKRPARKEGSIEVDVWAEKRVSDIIFKVYVSCKNWDRDVDRSVVDEEFGRVSNLQEIPHLKILVVKSMSDPARKTAEADGFFVIELREKAEEANAEKIYALFYKKISDLFTGIAPPQLLEIARKVNEISGELGRIAQELARLSKGYG